MRAAFAIPGDLATQTGGYVYARRVLRALPDLGIEIAHIALPDGFPNANEQSLANATEALQQIAADRPVLLDGLAGGVLPARMLAALPAPVVMLCHHPLALETGVSPEDAVKLGAAEQAALNACHSVVTTSHATADILIRDYSVAPGKLTVAPPGTDPAPRAPADGPCRILCVGSLTRRKRHDLLVRALAEHCDHDWSMQIVGPARDARVKAELDDLIADLNLGDRIVLRGELGISELAASYQNADLFALASEYEGFGMAFTEAMSHGLPTLGIDCAAVAEATSGGARLVATDAFASALGALIRDPAERKSLADDAWRTAQTLLRWPQSAAIIADTLRKAAP